MSSGSAAVRFATMEDLPFLLAQEYAPEAMVRRRVELGEVIVAEREGEVVGLLRFEWMWSEIPFIGLIRVEPEHRKQGVGRAMLAFLEAHLLGRELHHKILMSSSEAMEPSAQSWHRHMGFVECGFIMGLNEGDVGEVFFQKTLE